MFKSKKDILNKVSKKDDSEELNEIKAQSPKTSSNLKDNEMNKNTESGGKLSAQDTSLENKTIDELNAKIKDLTDKLLRKAAEFDNYKKRTENELSSYYKFANEKLIVDLLPILDDFERLNASWNEKHDAEKYKEGIDLIYDKFKKVLKQHGLKEMESLGKPFDVNLHEALLQIPKDKIEPNTVVDELEKGYYLKDKVIRHAKVIVSSASDSSSSSIRE